MSKNIPTILKATEEPKISASQPNSKSETSSSDYLHIDEIQVPMFRKPNFRTRVIYEGIEIFTEAPKSPATTAWESAYGAEPILQKEAYVPVK